MGQRADNFLHAFDGVRLDWDAVLGVGFDAAPKHWPTIYRECSPAEFVRVARQGLAVTPPDLRHPEIREEMELLDRFRPPEIVRRGISRLNAIYAVPTPETPRFSFRKERIILEMKVNPAEAFVGDMDFITCLIPFIGVSRDGLERFRGAFKKYWESVIPLDEFLQRYSKIDTADGSHWIAKQKTPKQLPKTYFSPEILVMTPVVSQQHVRILRHEIDEEYADDDGDDPVGVRLGNG